MNKKRIRGFLSQAARVIVEMLADPRSDWLILILCIALILSLVSSDQVSPGEAAPKPTPWLPIPTGTATHVPAAPTTKPTILPTLTPPWELAMDLYFASLPYPLRRPAGQWTVSADGVQFVAFWEGFRAAPYNDGGEKGNCTVGYGELLHLGSCTGYETVSMSQSSAYTLLETRLNKCGSFIADYVTVPITRNQYNAMASLICNWGYSKFGQSETVRLTNEGRIMEAGKVWRNTATCGINIGCGLPGLIRRRKMESYFFTSPVGVPMWPFDEREVE